MIRAPARTEAAADTLADTAGTQALLRCWVREAALARPADATLRLDLTVSGVRVAAAVEYWSPTGWHRFGPARFADGARIDAVTLAALLSAEAHPSGSGGVDLAGRVADSVRRVARSLAERADEGTCPGLSFLGVEQALLLGHPLHPTPKSREGMTDAEDAAYCPERRGSFALHWFAADPTVVAADSDLGRSAGAVSAGLAGPRLARRPGTVVLPAHPWQAREVITRPRVARLLERGLLHDLGRAGPKWSATSSVRTVYRAGAPVMLKLSLGVEITNSKRENLRLELARGVAVQRLLRAGLADAIRAAHPRFGIIRDPAWLALDPGGEEPETGLEVAIRDNPFPGDERVGCLAGLVAERPDRPDGRSLLATVIHNLAARTGRALPDVAGQWLSRYLQVVVAPVLWLYGTYGLGLEAHQQNTLVLLDEHGWPDGGRYRDNQGYYFSDTRSDALSRWLPGAGRDLGTWCPDRVIDERLGYYVGINNVFGLIGAMGSQGLAGERALLRRTRAMLAAHADALPLARTLLGSPTLRCKANLLTRVAGMDELTGPLAAQSVYVNVPNPLVVAAR